MKQIWVTEASYRRLEGIRHALSMRDVTEVLDYAAYYYERQIKGGRVNAKGDLLRKRKKTYKPVSRRGIFNKGRSLTATIMAIPFNRPFTAPELVALGFNRGSVTTMLGILRRERYLQVLAKGRTGPGGIPPVFVRVVQPDHETQNRPTENQETHGEGETSGAVTENPDALADGDAGTPE